MTLTRDRVSKAIRTPAATYALCSELGRSGELESIYLVLAAIAGGATEWFDDEMRVELRRTGEEECTLDVLVDIGDDRRERLFRPLVVTISEVAARVVLDGARDRIYPLEALAQKECIVHTTLEEDRRRDDSDIVVPGTEPVREKAPRPRTIHGIQREGGTLPFGLPLVHPTHPKWRPKAGAIHSATLPFGPGNGGSDDE